MSSLGKRFKAVRKAFHLAQADLAARSRVRQSTVSAIERGQDPHHSTLANFANALGIDADQFIDFIKFGGSISIPEIVHGGIVARDVLITDAQIALMEDDMDKEPEERLELEGSPPLRFGELVLKGREALNLTREKFAEKVGMGVTANRIEEIELAGSIPVTFIIRSLERAIGFNLPLRPDLEGYPDTSEVLIQNLSKAGGSLGGAKVSEILSACGSLGQAAVDAGREPDEGIEHVLDVIEELTQKYRNPDSDRRTRTSST